MTVTTVATALSYHGNGLTTTFVTPFYTIDTDIVAIFRNSAGGSATLTLGTDYTVEGAGEAAGGTLTIINPSYVPDFATDGSTLVIDTAIPATQPIDLPEGGPFPSADVEAELDRVTRLIQQLQGSVARCIGAPVGDLATSMQLPAESLRKSRVLAFDASGNPVVLTIAELALLPSLLPVYPMRTAADAGLYGDGLTDDSYLLQVDMAVRGALTYGTTYLLSASEGSSFYFANRIRVPSNIQLIFLSPVRFAPKAGITMRGTLATVAASSGARLLVDAVAGGTTLSVDTTPLGGGALSNYFAANDVLYLQGQLDGCATPLQEQVVRVTGVSGTTLTLAEELSYAFQATYAAGDYAANYAATNYTLVSALKQAALTVDWVEGANTGTVGAGQVGNINPGDWVIPQDEKRQTDIGGAGTGYVHREIARVVATGEGGVGNVRLHRRLSRACETAYHATLLVMHPVTGASVQGATAVFTAVADSSPWSTFEAKWAVSSQFAQCVVPNADDYGSRGNGFRRDYCFGVDVAECRFEEPKYLQPGEGYGFYTTHSTACPTRACYARGARHSFIRYNATDCNGWDNVSENCQLSDFDWHGGDEYGCVEFNPTATGGSTTASSSLGIFTFGDATGLGGTRSCGVRGGKVERDGSTLGYAIRFECGTTGNTIRGCRFKDVYQLVYHADIPGFGALISSQNAIEDCEIDGVVDWMMYAVGNASGSTYRTLDKFRFAGNTVRNVSKLFYLVQLGAVELSDNDIDLITEDGSYTYVVTASDVLHLKIEDNKIAGMPRGFSLTTCPDFRIADNKLPDCVHGTVLNMGGGCTGGEWRENECSGYEPTVGRTATDIIVEDPRLAGPVTIAANGVFKAKPPRKEGFGILKKVGHADVYARFSYTCTGSPNATKGDLATGAPFYFGDGTLTGTTNGVTPSVTMTIDTSGNFNCEDQNSGGTWDLIWLPG